MKCRIVKETMSERGILQNTRLTQLVLEKIEKKSRSSST